MSNPGNTGHTGYKMSKITAIENTEHHVVIRLECGHTQEWEPYYNTSPAAWAKHIQEGERPIVVGKTRLRCNNRHQEASA